MKITKPMKKLKHFLSVMTLVLAVSVILSFPALADEGAPAIRVQNLAEFIPERDPIADQISFTFLSNDRLLILSDRISLIGLDSFEIVNEAPFPESLSDPEMIFRSDRVQELETGFGWFVERLRENFFQTKIALYQYDDSLNLICETDLNQIIDVPTTILFGLAQNGVDLFYKSDSMNLYRRNLDTGDDTLIFEMNSELKPGTFGVNGFRLIRGGETIFFEGSQYVPDDPDHTTHHIYGMMSADGEEITIKDAKDFSRVDYESSSSGPFSDHTPVTSPAALIILPDPIPENMDDFKNIPPKSLFVWNAKNGEISEIPLRQFLEDRQMALSAQGNYLATVTREDFTDESSPIIVRVYDAKSGTELASHAFANGHKYFVQTIAVCEETQSVKLIYAEEKKFYYADIPFETNGE